jgi:hypothetical protein
VNAYFQFLTQCQSKASIDLIRIPALLNAHERVGGVVTTSAGGVLSCVKFDDIEALSDSLSAVRFNELELIYNINQAKIEEGLGPIREVNAVLASSPTSELWFPSKQFIRGDRASRNRRMNASMQEDCLTSLGVTQKPTILELVLQFAAAGSGQDVLRCFGEWLMKALGDKFSTLEVFGCVDLGGPELFVRLESNALMAGRIRIMAKVLPTGYPELGDKFDDLHPLMFGTKRACSRIATALGRDARLICGGGSSDFSVVQLNPKCDIAAARERARTWLLPGMPTSG